MNIRPLSEALALKAKNEISEDPSKLLADLNKFKEMLAEQPHINARTDDQWLLAFLRGNHHDLETALEKLDLFYTLRTITPENTIPLDPLYPAVQEVLNAGTILPLNKTVEPDGPRIMLMRPGKIDVTKVSMLEFHRIHAMYTYLQLLEDDHFVVAGQNFIADMSNMSIAHMIQITPTILKKLVLKQSSFPIRENEQHYINTPTVVQKGFNLFTPFIDKKLMKKTYMHSDLEDLQKLIPKSILPAEYGGENGTIQDIIDEWKLKMEGHRDWFLEDAKYKTDESKRRGGPKTSETLFGIDDQFLKFEYD